MRRLLKITYLTVITIAVALTISLLAYFNILEKWHLKLTNLLYSRNEASSNITMVYIDNKSLDDNFGLGRFQNWRRTYYATAIKNLETKGAKVIGIDVIFPEKSRGVSEEELRKLLKEKNSTNELSKYTEKEHPDDIKLSEELNKNKNIVLITYAYSPKKETNKEKNIMLYQQEIKSIPLISKQTPYNAFVSSFPDEDKIIRRLPVGLQKKTTDQFTESLPLQIARLYLQTGMDKTGNFLNNLGGNYYHFDKSRRLPIKDGQFLINYAAPPYGFKYLSFVDVYKNDFKETDVKNKIVLIGAEEKRLQDNWPTPNSADTLMPGVEIQANAIQTILDNKFLQEQSVNSQIITIASLAVASVIILNYLNILLSIIYILLAVGLYTFLTKFSFDRGLILNLVYPYLTLLFAYICMLIYRYFTEIKAKRELKFAFSHYVNPTVVNEIIKHPENLKLGGEKRDITVFFSDIAHFTTVSESMTPEQTISFLNEYLDAMTQVIMKYGGTLDKYEGDAIIAFFGAPLPQPDHALKACLATLETRAVLKNLHQKWQQEGKPLIDFRVGLNSGPAVVGNVGSDQHFDYTMIGDTVNLGSRLEGANKFYGTNIMISETTAEQIKNDFLIRKLDLLRVVGKQKPVAVFELLGQKNNSNETTQTFLENYNEAIQAYAKRDFISAQKFFNESLKIIPEDTVSKLYLDRCQQFITSPPPTNWDGVSELKSK